MEVGGRAAPRCATACEGRLAFALTLGHVHGMCTEAPPWLAAGAACIAQQLPARHGCCRRRWPAWRPPRGWRQGRAPSSCSTATTAPASWAAGRLAVHAHVLGGCTLPAMSSSHLLLCMHDIGIQGHQGLARKSEHSLSMPASISCLPPPGETKEQSALCRHPGHAAPHLGHAGAGRRGAGPHLPHRAPRLRWGCSSYFAPAWLKQLASSWFHFEPLRHGAVATESAQPAWQASLGAAASPWRLPNLGARS